MTGQKWNRRPKRHLTEDNETHDPSKILTEHNYKVSRVRTKRKKRRHPGFTVVPEHRLWIFENND